MIKDEHLYLEEWIEYHLNLGFSNILLYEDYGSKTHKKITNKYSQVELHHVKECPKYKKDFSSRQCQLYNYILTQIRGKYDWALFIDVDEFLHLSDGYSVERLINESNDAHGIELFWKCYGANNLISPITNSVIKDFSSDYKELDWDLLHYNFKSFVNLNK
jgi:hypothetical protein